MKKLGVSTAFVLLLMYVGVTSASAESYEVQEGDSLWQIADKYDSTVNDLIDINELKTTVIQPKQELTIYETYTVEKGETLGGIAKKFDVTVDDLKEWNELDTHIIQIDQELKVKGTKVTESEDKEAKSTDEKEQKTATPEAKEETTQDKSAEVEQDKSTEPEAEPKAEAKPEPEQKNNEAPKGETVEVTATAYTAQCEGCSGVTSTGVDLNANPDADVIAVDPSVIPLGSKVYVEGYGYATAADTGGAIKGNKIDVHVPTKGEATNWGVQTVNVTIVE